jgi:hypothetical protein
MKQILEEKKASYRFLASMVHKEYRSWERNSSKELLGQIPFKPGTCRVKYIFF